MKTITTTELRNKFGDEIEHLTDEMLSKIIDFIWLDKTLYTDEDLLDFILAWGLFENFADAAEHYDIELTEEDFCDRDDEAREKLNKAYVFTTLDDEDYRVMVLDYNH